MQRWPACLAAMALFAFASTGLCKPPDLPHYQRVTVLPQTPEVDPHLLAAFGFMSNYPIQILDTGDPLQAVDASADKEAGEVPVPEPIRRAPREEPECEGCPYRPRQTQATPGLFDPAATRSVMENLKLLEQAADAVEKARELAREGQVREAAECLEQVRKLVPGSPCEKTIEELMNEIAAEEQQGQTKKQTGEEPQAGCCHGIPAFGGCWMGHIFQLNPNNRMKIALELKVAKQARRAARREQQRGDRLAAACQEKLCRVTSVRFRGVPLASVLEHLRGATGCDVVIDFEGLDRAGVTAVTPVTVEVDGAPMYVVLDLMLRPHRLQAIATGSVLKVTCADECGQKCRTPVEAAPSAREVSACPKCEALHGKAKARIDGKAEMVNGLMKACRLAIGGGRFEKAAELARQAHAVDPAQVEGDPMVIKLDLLNQYRPAPKGARLPTTGGSEEAAEEPVSAGEVLLVPHFPGLDPKIVEALDAVLKGKDKPKK